MESVDKVVVTKFALVQPPEGCGSAGDGVMVSTEPGLGQPSSKQGMISLSAKRANLVL